MKSIKAIKLEISNEIQEYGCVSLSSGTLKTEDLLEAIQPFVTDDQLNKNIELALDYLKNSSDSDEGENHVYWTLQEAYDYMDELCPEGYYFGSHPGDASDIGFWQVDEL